jgi:phosphoribosyl 1,2-cyclic phosphodiesterase
MRHIRASSVVEPYPGGYDAPGVQGKETGMPLKICALASGSSGNATWISTGKTSVLVDCGAAARDVVERLERIGMHPGGLDGILITHAHSDHYRSAGTIHARYGVPVFVDPATARAARRRGSGSSWRRITETRPIPQQIGDLEVRALDTRHGFPPDEGRTVAFLLGHKRSRVAVVTDLGEADEALLAALRGVDAIVLEANHDAETIERKLESHAFARDWEYLSWVLGDHGHLSNRQCAEALARILTGKACHVFLGHLSENHVDPLRDNNDHRRAQAEVRRYLEQHRVPVPHLHRTYRIGREASQPSVVAEV